MKDLKMKKQRKKTVKALKKMGQNVEAVDIGGFYAIRFIDEENPILQTVCIDPSDAGIKPAKLAEQIVLAKNEIYKQACEGIEGIEAL